MTNITDNKITFAYPLDWVFDEVSAKTAYLAKNISIAENGSDPADTVVITLDEKEFVCTALTGAIAALFELFVAQSERIDNAIFLNDDGSYGFTVNTYTAFNSNRLVELDYTCGEFLQNYILCQWASNLRSDVGEKIYAPALMGSARSITAHKAEIFKRPHTKTYNVIVKDGSIL